MIPVTPPPGLQGFVWVTHIDKAARVLFAKDFDEAVAMAVKVLHERTCVPIGEAAQLFRHDLLVPVKSVAYTPDLLKEDADAEGNHRSVRTP